MPAAIGIFWWQTAVDVRNSFLPVPHLAVMLTAKFFHKNLMLSSAGPGFHEIASMLAEHPSGFGRPCSDRTAWSGRTAELNSLIKEAQQATTTPLAPFDEAAYLQFTKTGDRQAMERNLNERTNQIVPLVLAECAEYQGRYLPRIAEVMDSLAAMPSWTLSAHDPLLLNLHGVRYFADLNAADMADNPRRSTLSTRG